ncbi:short chain dehydrogenase [uncultured Shewanella sp.]|uniref:short chain dehydrogenase n=1 Tax=uncultured Shewanella sp. TaxID=173975 RepID=UPI0026048EE2|nr:short chain dehydrogenase [uncultured Shewanella sp.]
MKTAIIAGSTGAIGTELLALLLKAMEYDQVHCLVRRPLGFSHPKLIVHSINYDEWDPQVFINTHPELMHGQVFCCLGSTLKQAGSVEAFKRIDKEYVLSVARFAELSSAKGLSLISAIGANARSSNYYTQTKGEVEQQVQQYHIPAIRIFRPSLLRTKRAQFRLGEYVGFLLLTLLSPLLQGKLKKYRAISTRQVAKALYLTSIQEHSGVVIFESDDIQTF